MFVHDVTGNVVWFDNLSAARAMLGLSKRILGNVGIYSDKNHNAETDLKSKEDYKDDNLIANGKNNFIGADDDEKKEKHVNIEDIDDLPPGIWRKGVDYPKSKGIFLRFATRMDRKQTSTEKVNEHKKYGNHNLEGKL